MKDLSGKTYNIITFGCQMNEHDSETMSGLLLQQGCVSVEEKKDADIVIINTCSVRENADKRFFGTLGQLKKQKAVREGFTVCVCGCMMQQEHIVTQVKQKYPWVDIVFGTHNIEELPQMLRELYRNREANNRDTSAGSNNEGEKEGVLSGREYTIAKHNIRSSKDERIIRIYDDRDDIVEDLPQERMFRHKSFVNIMFGCNNFCSYCIVPYTRGREKSRRSEDIINEVKDLVDDGVREITLLGQNVNSYKGDSREIADFTDLIYELNDIDGLDRIRFMTSHPKDLSDRLIVAFAQCDKLCKYIHLPVQAGSDRVLERMNRKYDRQRYMDLVSRLREAVPGMALSTDIIVGFPGETEEDFRDTLDLVKRVGFDSAFTFLYSPRQGTPAATYSDQIPEDIKHERFDRLVETLNSISFEKNRAYIGRTLEVLVDGPAKKDANRMMAGRTDGFKLVDFPGDEGLAGSMVKVRITDAKTFSLSGELESQS